MWEEQFLDEVARYTLKVIRAVGPTKGVYIAVDGVAPMAKIKQQRLRRFKGTSLEVPDRSKGTSAPVAEVPDQIKGTSVEPSVEATAAPKAPSWDKNALTPGTLFMDKLAARLRRLVTDYQPADQRWIISDTSEPGEGEQKIMAQIRAGLCGSEADAIVVYGLDADLIVLSMWTRTEICPTRPIWLFRERVERGEMVRNAVGEEMFEWFSIGGLEDAVSAEAGLAGLVAEARREYIQDYCAAMMLLGNDFLPTSMTFRLKENGHGRLLDMLQKVRGSSKPQRLWTRETGVNLQAWQKALRYLSNQEDSRFLKAIQKKLEARGDDMDPEDEPLRVRADAVFLAAGAAEPALRADWRRLYAEIGFGGNVRGAVDTYIQGMSWIVNYYTGVPVNMEWVYPWHFAPLWSDLAAGLQTSGWIAPPSPGARILRPVEQLGMVLPLRSWGLIPDGEAVRRLPEVAPEWFPTRFGLNSIGKRYAWECEPEIPIPLPAQVWAVLA